MSRSITANCVDNTIVVVCLLFTISFVAADSSASYTTAETVSALSTDSKGLGQVSPPVRVCPGLPTCQSYLSSLSCLGYFGPIGPYGPLGYLGPLEAGAEWFNNMKSWSSQVTSGMTSPFKDQSSWLDRFTGDISKTLKKNGPLSNYGPLGPQGPLGDSYGKMGSINDFAGQMYPLGLFSVLGPIGVLGAVGPLGPLGPLGAHGFVSDSNGVYLNDKKSAVRTVSVPFGNSKRTYALYERYNSDYAKNMDFADNDCSWYTKREARYLDSDTYKFSVSDAQYVTIVVVPFYQLDVFSVTIKDGDSQKVIAKSAATTMINWIQFRADANTKYSVNVKHVSSFHILPQKPYYLYVTGSTPYISTTDMSGPHIKTFSSVASNAAATPKTNSTTNNSTSSGGASKSKRNKSKPV